MTRSTEHNVSTAEMKAVIHGFLQERLQPKLDKLKEGEDERRQQLQEAHQPENWIADAARRVGQIQQVTHALKYTHPDARGTSLSSPGNQHAGELLIGTHTGVENNPPDVVGNAAALDVYKFLRLELGGKSLLQLAVEKDTVFQAALAQDEKQAAEWMASFAALTESKGQPASSTRAKQIYWPLSEGDYHLLAPLFPTSLVHQVWRAVRDDRFSEEAKAAREARRNGKPHAHGYREYPNLLVQQFGGTKPQNISQLNSERYGENYLLPSLPPVWRSTPVKPPLHVESVFSGWFGRRRRVHELLDVLRGFFYSVSGANSNIRIRNKRKALLGYLVDELVMFAAELQQLEGSWSADDGCKLNLAEQCWLNPDRKANDAEFAASCHTTDWQTEVCSRFANWLNARLTDGGKSLPFGESEAREWRNILGAEMDALQREMKSDE